MQKLHELRQQHTAALDRAENCIKASEAKGKIAVDGFELIAYNTAMADAVDLEKKIKDIEANNTLSAIAQANDGKLIPAGPGPGYSEHANGRVKSFPAPGEDPRATAYRSQFSAWLNNTLAMIDGRPPQMEATASSGAISIGSGTGLDSVALTVPTEVLPYLPSYYALDSFGLAGATQFYTDNTRPLVKPILSAGAADSEYAEGAAPATSQPFGVSGFTFEGTKYSRLVLATYESLMNSELPLAGAILDELLASLATTLTSVTTTSFVAALVAAASSLAVGVGGSGGSIYTSMIDLRYAVPPRFDLPTNKWMLSRATLAQIRNTRANSSGVPMFSADGTALFDRPYVINDNLDTATGAGVGFVAFGSFADGVWLRRTPIVTRVFQELYAQTGEIGYRTTQWNDAHFLAELAGAAQPPTFQPIYYTNVVSES